MLSNLILTPANRCKSSKLIRASLLMRSKMEWHLYSPTLAWLRLSLYVNQDCSSTAVINWTQLRDSLSSAIFLASPNEHYSVPQGVEKNYTGRTGLLNDVNQAFNAPSAPREVGLQKRIVIYGLGGSGKTQFCCKYASLCRQRQVEIDSVAVMLTWNANIHQ